MSLTSIAILSPGLLGGSLALSVRKRLPGVEVRVWARRAESVERVKELGLAAAVSTDVREIAKGAGLVVFCMPIGAMGGIADQVAGVVGREALVTDVGSVKGRVVKELGGKFAGKAEFVGSHPMAGSEKAGLGAADEDLFEGAMTIVTPVAETRRETVEAVSEFWRRMGCRVAESSPEAHDRAMAMVSHLPHLTAAALVQAAMRENPAALEWRGNGFLDTTRVASGPAAMWAEILIENREAMKGAAQAMIENLREVIKLLEAGDNQGVEHYLAEAKGARDRLKGRTRNQ